MPNIAACASENACIWFPGTLDIIPTETVALPGAFGF